MKVQEFMLTDVPVVKVGASLRDVAAVLAEHEASAVIVVDETGEVVGVVSETVLASVLKRITDDAEDIRSETALWAEIIPA
ncbi:MAG TPA: CBS domain-containing protein [Actinomycetota bacterium]